MALPRKTKTATNKKNNTQERFHVFILYKRASPQQEAKDLYPIGPFGGKGKYFIYCG